MKAVCTNPNCRALFIPRNALQLYCSRKCSAHVRNRRYYCTPSGRDHKRVAASQYFQTYKHELYERKAARFQQHCEREQQRRDKELQQFGFSDEDLLQMSEAQRIKFSSSMRATGSDVRALHDYHPAAEGSGYMGRWLWLLEDGELVQRLVRGNDTDYRCGFRVNEIGELVAISPDQSKEVSMITIDTRNVTPRLIDTIQSNRFSVG